MPELNLTREEKHDLITVCPMCKEKDSIVISFSDASNKTQREIHTCQPCPCIWFDYYHREDIIRLMEDLDQR